MQQRAFRLNVHTQTHWFGLKGHLWNSPDGSFQVVINIFPVFLHEIGGEGREEEGAHPGPAHRNPRGQGSLTRAILQSPNILA